MKYIIVIVFIALSSYAANAQEKFEILRQEAITLVEQNTELKDDSAFMSGKTIVNWIDQYSRNGYQVRLGKNPDGSMKFFSIKNLSSGFLIVDFMKKGADGPATGPYPQMFAEYLTAFLR